MKLTHDALVGRLRKAARAISLRDAADAWLASLVSAPLQYRPALAHLTWATNLPQHPFVPSAGEQNSYLCAVCGAGKRVEIDAAELLESLEESGQASITDAEDALVALERFSALDRVTPTDEDLACFDAMLEVLARLPGSARATDLVKRWKVPRSNAYARAALVETLGACGVLETIDHPGQLTRWVGFWEHEERPSLSGELGSPQAWWRKAGGVNRGALELLFSRPGIDLRRFPRGRAGKREIGSEAVTVSGRRPAVELRPRDLIGIEFGQRWICGVVLGAHREGRKTLPVIEFFADALPRRPAPGALAGKPARVVGPYRDGAKWRREPLALEGLELFGPVMEARLEVLGEDHAPPSAGGAPATHHRVVTSRNLLYLLSTLLAGRAIR